MKNLRGKDREMADGANMAGTEPAPPPPVDVPLVAEVVVDTSMQRASR